MFIIEYTPHISDEAAIKIEKFCTAEMSNQETSQYEIYSCIDALQGYSSLVKDREYLIELAEDDMHPRSYIEF